MVSAPSGPSATARLGRRWRRAGRRRARGPDEREGDLGRANRNDVVVSVEERARALDVSILVGRHDTDDQASHDARLQKDKHGGREHEELLPPRDHRAHEDLAALYFIVLCKCSAL